jgi:hypothetical protein
MTELPRTVPCPKCQRAAPAHALHCLVCGAALSRVVNLDGQLALQSLLGAPPRAVALLTGGVQAELRGEVQTETAQGRPVTLRFNLVSRGATREALVELAQVITAVQRQEEVVDVG